MVIMMDVMQLNQQNCGIEYSVFLFLMVSK